MNASSVISTNSRTLNLNVFIRQMPIDLLEKLREEINAAENLTIAPSFMVDEVSTIIIYLYLYYIFTVFLYCASETWCDREFTQGGSGGSGAGREVELDDLIVLGCDFFRKVTPTEYRLACREAFDWGELIIRGGRIISGTWNPECDVRDERKKVL